MTVTETMTCSLAKTRTVATIAATVLARTTITAPTAMPETAAAILAASAFAATTSMATRVVNAVAMNYCYSINNSDRSSNYIRNDGIANSNLKYSQNCGR